MQEQEAQVAAVTSKTPARPSLRKGGKSANSPEAVAPTVKAKAASKPTAQPAATVQFTPRTMVKGQPIFALDEISRPRSGRLLLAHTHAALTILGLLSEVRPAIPKTQLLTLIGARAVKYHIDHDNLEAAPDHGIRLSIKGYNTFKDRTVDAAAANGFQSAFLDGKLDAAINVKKGHLYQTRFA